MLDWKRLKNALEGLKFIAVFFQMGWTVIWAGKKKACPYILFKD